MDVSVIVQIYNGENNAKMLIDALHKQNISNIEFIIINDGSVDKTDLIVKQTLNKLNDTRFVYKNIRINKGVSNARNVGISIARGEYLMFIDSDDSFPENFVSKYLYKIREKKTDIEFFSFNKQEDQKKYVDYSRFDDGSMFGSKELLRMFLSQQLRTFLFSFISKSSLWSSDTFSKDISYQEDTLAIMNILLHNKVKASFNSASYYSYNSDNDRNVSNNLSISQYWQAVKVDEKIENNMYSQNEFKSLIPNMRSKKLSELMSVISKSLSENDMSNYYKARQMFIETYKTSQGLTFKQKLKRKLQYYLLTNNKVSVLKNIYSWL